MVRSLICCPSRQARHPHLLGRIFPFHDDDLLHREGSQEASPKTARSERTAQGVSRYPYTVPHRSPFDDITTRRIQRVLQNFRHIQAQGKAACLAHACVSNGVGDVVAFVKVTQVLNSMFFYARVILSPLRSSHAQPPRLRDSRAAEIGMVLVFTHPCFQTSRSIVPHVRRPSAQPRIAVKTIVRINLKPT